MDPDDMEEMLFGFPSSQESLEDDGDDDSEDDMLEDLHDANDDLWQTYADAMLTPPATSPDPDVNLFDDVDSNVVRPSQLDVEVANTLVKDKYWVVARIEGMIEKILDALLDESLEMSFMLSTRAGATRRKRKAAGEEEAVPPPKRRKISFPGGSAQEAWRFTVLTSILELVHGCLIDNVVMTKRDIYYRHPDLFVKQTVVDRYIDDLACTFGVPRSMLNVTAAAKGLVAGNFLLWRDEGACINGRSEKEGILVPKIHSTDVLDLSLVHWILVIEKEATFRSLLGSPRWKKLGSEGIAVTAKGYPDIASRRFLRHLADHSPYVPMYCLVDFDPDGIAIMSTYKHGSYRLAHENDTGNGTPTLDLPKLRWLGVQSHQISRAPVTECDTSNGWGAMLDAQGLMRLTPRDRKKATNMLEWDVCAEDGPEQAWRRELQTMLMLNFKAEMQILEDLPGGLTYWLEKELEGKQG